MLFDFIWSVEDLKNFIASFIKDKSADLSETLVIVFDSMKQHSNERLCC